MKCDDVVINLPDYILGKVEPNLERYMEEHLGICTKCKAEFEEIAESIMVLGKVEHEEYPDAFWQELRAMIMEKAAVFRPARWKVPSFAGALAILLLAIGIGIYEHGFNHGTNSNGTAKTLAAFASSLPASEVAELPSLNINFVDVAAPQVAETDEITAVDDSMQQAVVNSLWPTAVTDSAAAMDYFDYPSDVISN